MTLLTFLGLAALPLSLPSTQQILDEPTLRADVEIEPAASVESFFRLLAESGSHTLFVSAGLGQQEFWTTDGTTAGTRIHTVTTDADELIIEPVDPSFTAEAAVLTDGSFVVRARVEGLGAELVRIDPSSFSVTVAADVTPGGAGPSPTSLSAAGGLIYSLVPAGNGEFNLVSTDGTPAGTQVLAILPAGTTPREIVAGANDLFVLAQGSAPGLYGYTPGAASAQLLASGMFSAFSTLQNDALPFDGGLLLPFDDGVHGVEPWFTDGTPSGTLLLEDLQPGPVGSLPQFLADSDGTALFAAVNSTVGREYYLTRGTAASTQLLGDFGQVSSGAPYNGASFASGATAIAGGFILSVRTPSQGIEPWACGLTPGSATPLADIAPHGDNAFVSWNGVEHQGRVYFTATNNLFGEVLYASDGTPAGTVPAIDFASGEEASRVAPLASLASGLFLVGELEDGLEPLISDGTLSSTSQLANSVADPVNQSSTPRDAVRAGDQVFFAASTEQLGRRLYAVRDGVPGAQLMEVAAPGFAHVNPQPLGEVDGKLLYIAEPEFAPGQFALRTSGAFPGSHVTLLEVGSGTSLEQVAWLDGVAYLLLQTPGGQRGLWRTDGTIAGTSELDLGLDDIFVSRGLRAFAGNLWLIGQESATGAELYRTDGTQAGTQLVADLTPGPGSTNGILLAATSTHLYFQSIGAAPASQVYSVDVAGTPVAVSASFLLPTQRVQVDEFAVVGDRFVFSTDGDTALYSPTDVYGTDGTQAGTESLGAFAAPSAFNIPEGFVEAGGVGFFWTTEQGLGSWTIWRTEGTAASTSIVESPVAPLLGVSAGEALGSGRQAIYPLSGTSDIGFWLVEDEPGAFTQIASYPVSGGGITSLADFSASLGGELLVAANDFLYGEEIHSLPIVELGGYVAEPYGSGCGNAHMGVSGEARVGETFSATLNATPGAFSVLYLAFQQGYEQLAPGCANLLGPATAVGTAILDAGGQAAVPFAVPSVPSLAGVAAYLQWAVVSPGGPLLGVLELSEGLEVVVGS